MSLSPGLDPAASALTALVQLTQALAGARTQVEVAQLLLDGVLGALDVVAGTALLVEDRHLRVLAQRGRPDDQPSPWAGAVGDDTPAAHALQRGVPLLFEHHGALFTAYPHLDVRSGGPAGASAALPLELSGRALGVVVLEFREPHTFSADEQGMFRILSVQCAVALNRVQQLGEQRAEATSQRGRAEALNAFVLLTEAVGLNTDLPFLIQRAREVLRLTLPDLDVDYFELVDDRWVSRFTPDDVPELLQPALETGLPSDTPAFVQAVRAGAPLFIDHWQADEQRVPHSGVYRMCAFAPYRQDDRPAAVLTSASQSQSVWTSGQQAVFTAVWRGLGGALERSALARRLERQEAQDAFVAFTEQSTTLTDVPTLARHAVEVLLATLGEVSVAYSQLEGGLWRAQVWSDDHEPAVVATLQAGIPVSAPSYAEAVGRREALFVAPWNAGHEQVERTEDYGAGAFWPYFAGAAPVGLLAMGTRRAHDWTERERGVFRSVASSLGLALERAALTQELQAQRAEMERRNVALEAFAQLSRDLALETDPYRLIHRAQEVALSMLSPGYALYYERDGDRWRNRAQVGDVGHAGLQAFIDAGPPVGETPTVDLPWTTGNAHYQDMYAQGSDTPAELVGHVGAAASLPVFCRGQPVGVFIAALFDPRPWSGADRAVLETAVRSLGLALDRSVQTQALEGERSGLNAFAAFTEAVGSETDVVRLARQAAMTVNAALDGVSVGYYERDGGVWLARAWSEDVDPETVIQMQAGVPQNARNFAEATRSRAPVFVNGWDAAANHLPSAARYGSAAFFPLLVSGEPRSILAAGLAEARSWTEREQAILRAVARGLGLALERAEATRQLESERAGLDAFAAFTEAVGSETDERALARQAAQVVRANLEQVSFVYYELDDNLWKAVVWSEDIDPQIVAQLRAGLPPSAPNFARAQETGAPVFVDSWNAVDEHLSSAAAYGAASFLPISVRGEVSRFVTAGTQEARAWTTREQRVIRAVVRGLSLALERAEQARLLRTQRDDLDARSAALASANAELEAFAYSVSHDLRTPVRHVMGFAELARQALDHAQPDKVSRHLGVVRQAAERMTTLIDGMLMLSRAGQDELRPSPVDLERLVRQARNDVEAEFGTQVIHWHILPLPQVWGSPELLQQVMTNLLSNAVKYSAGRAVSEVQVLVADRSDEWEISVRDNGVGFNPAYTSKLFRVFQRLHSEQEFTGTGVGLATVRRIVLKHGGQVFAESSDEQGATFGFTLPKKS